MNIRERESKLHLEIRRWQDKLGAIINKLQSGSPMIRGSIYIRKRKCGKPRCRCVRGYLHLDRVLAIRREGRVKLHRIYPVRDAITEEAVLAWRRFRGYRAELVNTYRRLIQAVDSLGRLRQTKAGRNK